MQTNTAKIAANNNRQKKQHFICTKQNKQASKKHGEKSKNTRTKNLNDLLPPRNFCTAEKRGTRLFFPAIAHKIHWCQEFFLGENKKRAPRGVLSSNEILAVFFKKNSEFFDWSNLISTLTRCSTVILAANQRAGKGVTVFRMAKSSWNSAQLNLGPTYPPWGVAK